MLLTLATGEQKTIKSRQNFLCGDSGFYKRGQGEIKGDTIIFYQTQFSPIKGRVIRKTQYVLSDMSFE